MDEMPCLVHEDSSGGRITVWLPGRGGGLFGGFSTLNGSAWPNDANVCSLSQVLETTASIPQRSFLSPKACRGIVRRASRRGRVLPPVLLGPLAQKAFGLRLLRLFDRARRLGMHNEPRLKAMSAQLSRPEPRQGGGSGLTSNATADSYPLNDLDGVSHSLSASGTASGYMDASVETYIAHAVTASDGGICGKDGGYGLIAHTLTGEGHDASEDGTGRGTATSGVPRPVCLSSKDDGRDITYDLAPTMRAMQNDVSWANGGGQLAVTCAIPLQVNGASGSNVCGTGQAGDPMLTLQAGVQHGVAIAFDTTQITSAENRSNPLPGDPCPTLVSDMHAAPAVAFNIYPLAGQGTHIDAAPTDVSTSVGATTHGSMTDRGTRVVQPAAVAFSMRTRDGDPQAEVDGDGEISSALRAADGGSTRPFLASTDVRRLTVVECERLQGFPDNWTLIHGDWRPRKPEDRVETIRYLMDAHGIGGNEAAVLADCPDGPRYRALGNSMATRCMAWIGRRIQDQCEL